MKPRTDLTGRVFGKLKVLRFTGTKVGTKYKYSWECLCSCGAVKEVLSTHLVMGSITHCGCQKRTRGGCSSHPLYKVWSNMVRRCTDPEDPAYVNYGGRGIRVSDEWMDPQKFIADMWPRPEGYTVERVDNDGHYSKDNCVWSDRYVQANNKRNVRLISHDGITMSIPQWARYFGIPAETLRSRINAGVPIDIALILPTHARKIRYSAMSA